ncbi:MAG: hypothetical protein ACI4XJ_04450 [Eubacteriales bacterium]
MKKNSTIALLLVSAILLSNSMGLVGCSKKTDTGTTDASENTSNTTSDNADAEETALSDDLPDKNFNGKDFRVAIDQNYEYDFFVEEMGGSVETDCIYERNSRLQERFDAKVTSVVLADNSTDCYNRIVQDVIADSTEYEIASLECWNLSIAISNGAYKNWKDIPYIDITKPWWNEYINDGSTIGGKLFGLTGTITTTYLQNIVTVYFNSNLITQYGYDNASMYKIVNDGKWTVDKARELAGTMYKDIDGNGVQDENDQIGFMVPYLEALDNFPGGFGAQYLVKDENGNLTQNMLSEQMINSFDKIYSFLCETPGVQYGDPATGSCGGINGSMDKFFTNNQAVFFASPFQVSFSSFRDMESNYGVLPYPKYDETQTRYYSPVADNYNILGCPKSVTDDEFVGIMVEALCADNFSNVYPAYYDIALKTKYSSDHETASMVDMIVSNASFDLAMLYGVYLERMPYKLRDSIGGKNPNMVSMLESIQNSVEYKLTELNKYYE